MQFAPSHGQWGEGEEILLSASYDNSIKVWAEEGGDWYCAASLESNCSLLGMGAVHTSTVWCLGVAPGGVRFLSGSEDGSMGIWKCYTANERKRLFSREQQRGVVSSTDGLWSCVGILPSAHSGYAVLTIDCAPSRVGHGRIVSAGGDNSIHVLREEMPSLSSSSAATGGGGGAAAADVATNANSYSVGSNVQEGHTGSTSSSSDAPKFTMDALATNAHDGDVNCVKWHPRDGTRLVSVGEDGAVKLWGFVRG